MREQHHAETQTMTTKRPRASWSPDRSRGFNPATHALFLVALGVFLLLSGCGRPAQIGPDREAFQAVDALYTAVSLRETEPLDRCERSLHDLREQGKLPEGAGRTLDAIIAQARDGEWETAQSRLGDFMRGQRR